MMPPEFVQTENSTPSPALLLMPPTPAVPLSFLFALALSLPALSPRVGVGSGGAVLSRLPLVAGIGHDALGCFLWPVLGGPRRVVIPPQCCEESLWIQSDL